MNLALIYNSDIRNNGTPVHFWHAFQQSAVSFARYSPKGKLPGHDFYVCLDDGRDDIFWIPPHPCGFYATDTHLGWDFRRAKAEHFDIVWCAQKPAAERMKAEGLNAHWLPLACNPWAHPNIWELFYRTNGNLHDTRPQAPKPLEPVFDWGFVGHLQPPAESDRIDFLDHLCGVFPNFRFAFGVFHEDMAHMYHQCRIGVNHAVRDDLNMRFFELASIGVPQVCDRRMAGLSDLRFLDGIHYLGYSSREEAVEQIKRGLEQPTLLKSLAETAFREVRTRHTYMDRAAQILEDIHEFLNHPVHSSDAPIRVSG